MFAERSKVASPDLSVPKPIVWANITTTNSTPVSARVPVMARGMLRCGSAVSSPIDAQASNPAQQRKAATTPPSTAGTDTPDGEKVLQSTPVGWAPPRAKITPARTTMAMMPAPSIPRRTLASVLTSLPVRTNDIAALIITRVSHGSWNGCSSPFCSSARNELAKAAVSASVATENPA